MKTFITFIFISVLTTLFSPLLYAQQYPLTIVVHGGAGTIDKNKMTPAKRKAYEAKLKEAIDAGYALLAEGKSSQKAVIAAIQTLEDSPLFNAGKGAVYTYDEKHELDASIMNGKTLQAGAVAGVQHIKSPIALAEKVMENSVHVMLSGQGAEEFAQLQGMTLVDNHYFDTKHRLKSLKKAKKKIAAQMAKSHNIKSAYQQLDVKYKYGTVGAVALDKEGNLSAATSTGGMTAKRFGRIGDSPIIGAGTYANNDSCAVSATGHGEYFIRYHVAADICARVQYQGKSLQQAADTVINHVLVNAGGSGGIIALDRKGNIAMEFNSSGMYRASRKQGQQAVIKIFKE